MATNRLNRDLETRTKEERVKQWQPPSMLPDPNPEPGYKFRWIRVSMVGETDSSNVAARFREGWEPVRAADHPEITVIAPENERYKDNIVIGGLMLCKVPEEIMAQRKAYYEAQTAGQMKAVNNNLMRENDSRMPLFREHKSKVTFGEDS